MRSYRSKVAAEGLVAFEVKLRETDLQILAARDYSEAAMDLVRQCRNQLENYLTKTPSFLSSLSPLPHDLLAPPMIQSMYTASAGAGVGPMAAVAGVVAEFVGRGLQKCYGLTDIVVENGGDIYLQRQSDVTVSVFAGTSPLSHKVGIRLRADQMPAGICTSSGTVGHSLSLGKADAVTVFSSSTALADAVATRIGNEIKNERDIDSALAVAAAIDGVRGVLIIKGTAIGVWGELELLEL
ncbi:MAG: UPF0280 family protein [Proteobacteria bacterium]|nr:UPF0280 family protein [Desulfobulbaceae bacterium]MBU4152788.1 UPF0280 family protein [Pseudomonadota bacterium]